MKADREVSLICAFYVVAPLALVVSIAMLIVSGCASDPAKVVTEERTTIVRVPTPVPCQVEIPKCPPSAMPSPDSDVARKAAGASADVRALRQCTNALTAALRACTADGGTP